ncbi:MAG: class I SAM-dependent methyltransferase [Bryobacteraceae bacterium]
MSDLNYSLALSGTDHFRRTISDKTQKVYDHLAAVYPVSTFFFHSKAHKAAMELSGVRDGMRVLEAATGSGEMFRRLVSANPNGETIGFDLSPKMAARTQRRAREEFPGSAASCQAVDARHIPFRDETFDAVICCYLLELLSSDDITLALREFRRVLKRSGKFTLVLIGQNTQGFNRAYQLGGRLAPAFWGRQIEQRVPEMIRASNLRVLGDKMVRQGFYPSRVLCARK